MRIAGKITTEYQPQRVERAAAAGTYRSLSHAAASLRLAARRLLRRQKGPSAPGQPPRTHTGRLKEAILYFVDRVRGRAVIGPSAEIVGPAGGAHEHGGEFRGQRFEKRPFMRPAFEANRARLPEHWRHSIHN